ncbi:PREDICTED: pentatricopeptide repeat-containing protein At1g74600, chloroplastic [Tarenaya hassleriana]|uniref:pentatricopeptide repeat-containing protein At1g74600, chloroplastic n=1 Tax=Tarenaya hassleriana TaxID=28532 RepID=UPI00053C09DB|nr:PREDICTED: pentatricopeptide repeat-containing protein At1g74600, chloroplastic [Tarenaya hassleriana]
MSQAKVVPTLRRLASLAQQRCPAPAMAAAPLELGSYLEENLNQVVYSHNREIDRFIKSGNLTYAQDLFDRMSERDVVSYNLVISGHSHNGCPTQAMELYAEMVSGGVRESASTFSSVLSICSDAEFWREGVQVHCRVISLGFGGNLFVASSLVGLHMSMRLQDVALKLFEEMPVRNVAACNLLLRWFSENRDTEQLFGVHRRMELEGVALNGLTYCYMIRGCCNDVLFDEGKQLHSRVIKSGWTDSNIFVANALVDFYSSCGSLIEAKKSFEAVPEMDVISWNSIVSAFADHGSLLDSVALFRRMQFWGMRPSIRSFVAFLNFCTRNGDAQFGKQTHCYILKMGLDTSSSIHVQSALIDMYGKCNDVESSVSVYRTLPAPTLECCNSLMTSLMHCVITSDVIEMFCLMIDEGIGIDEVTLSTVLKALSLSAPPSFPSFTSVHCCAVKSGYATETAVSCSLIEGYSRCGQVELSRKVFDDTASPNVFCFTSIISGYARNGMGRDCINTLREMDQKGVVPDEVTLLCVLSGCSHSGLVEEGQLVFESMESKYGISPGRKHYSCMVDVLGRAGLVEKAEELLLQSPPVESDCVSWSSLLQSCRLHRKEAIGRRAATVLLDLAPNNFSVHIQVSNFYSEIGESELSIRIREIAKSHQLMREIGFSSVVVNISEQL